MTSRLCRKWITGRTGQKPGQAIVEMAVIMTVLLTLMIGTIDMGIFMYKYVQAANCVRESARRAVVRDPDAGSPDYCLGAELTPSLTPGYMTLPTGEEVTATIDVPYNWAAIDTFVPGLGSVHLKASTTMKMEGQKL